MNSGWVIVGAGVGLAAVSASYFVAWAVARAAAIADEAEREEFLRDNVTSAEDPRIAALFATSHPAVHSDEGQQDHV